MCVARLDVIDPRLSFAAYVGSADDAVVAVSSQDQEPKATPRWAEVERIGDLRGALALGLSAHYRTMANIIPASRREMSRGFMGLGGDDVAALLYPQRRISPSVCAHVLELA